MKAGHLSLPPAILADSPEALVVGLARAGDRDAFADLVRRRQSWIRNLMRRFSGDASLADDLAQQIFLQAWRKVPDLQKPDHFAAWLKQIAVNIWLQHLRRHDALRHADDIDESHHSLARSSNGDHDIAMDLDRALATLSPPERLCVVLNYHEGMSHREISEASDMPVGTVKSHIRRGTEKLQQQLSDYQHNKRPEASS